MVSYQTKLLLNKGDWMNPSSLEDLGYIYYGPLLFNYFDWLRTEIGECDKLLFNSREGFFLQEIYELFREQYQLPQSVYFKTSRRLSSVASFKNEKDIYHTFYLHRYCGKLSNLLEQRFGIKVEVLDDVLVNTSIEMPNLTPYLDIILTNSNRVRIEYEKYIMGVIGDSKNVLMIDSGYQGTTQYNIQKTFGLKFKGRYILYKGHYLLEDVKGFYDFEKQSLKDNIIFLESVLTDKVGSYIDIVDGDFITEESSQNQKYFESKIQIINGVKQFISDMFKSDIFETNELTSKRFPDYMFDLMCTDGYIKNEKLFDSFYHDNFYTRNITKKINRK
jgi:hypothetical protein